MASSAARRRCARSPASGGPDRERQFDGLEPDRAGPQHRRSDDRGRQRRFVEKDHRRRARRDFAAQGSHQHDGRSAALVRLGGDARRARGRHRRQARRPGDRARRRRNLEGPDRLGQRDGQQPDAQVRNIAEVTTAVARGDLSRKITVDVSGEILELKNTINTMVDQLNAFAAEVTRVAREVGTEGQASAARRKCRALPAPGRT